MKKYVKFINEMTIQEAPRNKGSIVNYNLCYDKLEADGYKELVVEEATTAEKPHIRYREEGNQVIQYASAPQILVIEKTVEELQMEKRLERNSRLTWWDWTQLPDNHLTEEEREEYKEYREMLRNWTEREGEWWNEEIPSFDKWKINKGEE